MQPTVLAVGDLTQASTALAACVGKTGLQFAQVKDATAATAHAAKARVEMLFADAALPLADIMSALKENKLNIPVVVCGPAQPVQNAVKAIRMGAIEYLSVPLEEALVNSLLEKITPKQDDSAPIAGDPKSLALLEQARQFAASGATVLLRGESGTGKEVYSNYIHHHSPRAQKSFVSVNCAAIPENLLESELFGHEKGAFSGALNKRIGKFQQADGGTLLLDEISEMDLALQAKLLRAIQERVIDPVGASAPVSVDIRLIATTNRDLEDYVAEGSFREDLYFRLNVVMLEIPALRERPGDIHPLAEHYARHYAAQNGVETISFTPQALEKLMGCYWKGNVRELENTVHRAVLVAASSVGVLGDVKEATIEAAHIMLSPMSLKAAAAHGTPAQAALSAGNRTAAGSASIAAAQRYGATASGGSVLGNTPLVARPVAEVERELILNTLNYCAGNRAHAADVLGISLRILREKIREYEAGGSTVPAEAAV